MKPSLPEDIKQLLRGLREPLCLDAPHWEKVLRLARMTSLHGRLAAANHGNPTLPDAVRRHLLSAARISAFNAHMLQAELASLLAPCTANFPVVALKGAAYALQRLPLAVGRFVSDADLLVPGPNLRMVESCLRGAGWESAPLDAYDERYYRDWSHETPPLRFPGRTLEVDLHHALTPVTGSLSFDPTPLFDASVPVPGSAFRVLCPEDQVLHACIHCFHDGDLALRVREVADIDALLRHFLPQENFAERLIARANQLGLQRPLWYGLHFARAWLATPFPIEVADSLAAPGRIAQHLMNWLVPPAMLPSDPDFPPPPAVRLARVAMLMRYHRQRMPLRMLVPHLARKLVLRMRARATQHAVPQQQGRP